MMQSLFDENRLLREEIRQQSEVRKDIREQMNHIESFLEGAPRYIPSWAKVDNFGQEIAP
jgi:hypothetical protein